MEIQNWVFVAAGIGVYFVVNLILAIGLYAVEEFGREIHDFTPPPLDFPARFLFFGALVITLEGIRGITRCIQKLLSKIIAMLNPYDPYAFHQ